MTTLYNIAFGFVLGLLATHLIVWLHTRHLALHMDHDHVHGDES